MDATMRKDQFVKARSVTNSIARVENSIREKLSRQKKQRDAKFSGFRAAGTGALPLVSYEDCLSSLRKSDGISAPLLDSMNTYLLEKKSFHLSVLFVQQLAAALDSSRALPALPTNEPLLLSILSFLVSASLSDHSLIELVYPLFPSLKLLLARDDLNDAALLNVIVFFGNVYCDCLNCRQQILGLDLWESLSMLFGKPHDSQFTTVLLWLCGQIVHSNSVIGSLEWIFRAVFALSEKDCTIQLILFLYSLLSKCPTAVDWIKSREFIMSFFQLISWNDGDFREPLLMMLSVANAETLQVVESDAVFLEFLNSSLFPEDHGVHTAQLAFSVLMNLYTRLPLQLCPKFDFMLDRLEELFLTGDYLILSNVAVLTNYLVSKNYVGMICRRPRCCELMLDYMFHIVEEQRDIDVAVAILAFLLSELESNPSNSALKTRMMEGTASEIIDNLMTTASDSQLAGLCKEILHHLYDEEDEEIHQGTSYQFEYSPIGRGQGAVKPAWMN